MSKFILLFQTIIKLGIANVLYVAWFRFTKKTGLRKHLFPQRPIKLSGAFFEPCKTKTDFPLQWKHQLISDADKIPEGQFRYFGHHWKTIGNPPDWYRNPFAKTTYPNAELNWTRLPDYHPSVGDIKNIWEPSRFDWIVTLAKAHAVTGKTNYIQTLNAYLHDWVEKNPVNTGPNWKCGQEASVRLFNLVNASLILSQSEKPVKILSDLVYIHLQRISPNIRYSISQDNNHGTSEATGLFIGGNWLLNSGKNYSKAKQYAAKGRKWLENRINKLVLEDGSFAQHSTTYHRVLIDTLIFAEYWRQNLELPAFSPAFYSKAKAAISWLRKMTDERSGNCPNLGHNDGAMFLNLHSCDYREFRPSLQTANVIFDSTKWFADGPWDEPLYWLNKKPDTLQQSSKPTESELLKGGYVILKSSNSWCLLRFPYFRFRPFHNDVFHFDLWHKGKNILCDSGTYSYNPSLVQSDIDLTSVHSHNTISFDGNEQMPRLGRFILGKWIKPDETGEINLEANGEQSWEGKYTDGRGNGHRRKITNLDIQWVIEDSISGNFKSATIGFNLLPEEFTIDDNVINASWGKIVIPPLSEYSIQPGSASDYYWEKHPIKRLIIQVDKPGDYITEINLHA
jgi:hypothetical protein